eukprot:14993920-Alexandrium_andersonii.AAC.1
MPTTAPATTPAFPGHAPTPVLISDSPPRVEPEDPGLEALGVLGHNTAAMAAFRRPTGHSTADSGAVDAPEDGTAPFPKALTTPRPRPRNESPSG